ncbi:MAG: hypothetical protein C0512_05300 [Flavobacterium sp.]|nr:hypothetical protein [Flavobacterium sp.]
MISNSNFNFMKKNKFNILLLTFLMAGFTFTSCENEDDATGDSVVIVNSGAAAIEAVTPGLVFSATNNVNEGGIDRTLEYAVTLQDVQPVDIYVTVTLASGDAVEGDDFDFDHSVRIPAFTKRGVGTVIIYGDGETESTETFTLKIGDFNDPNVSFPGANLAFNITDFGDLNLVLDWNTTFEFSGISLTLCDIGYDVDYYLLDAEGNDVSGFQAATGACPEEMIISMADVEDGTYELTMNLYDDAGLASVAISPAFEIKTTVNYTRDNSSFSGSFMQDSADAIDSDFGNVPNYDSEFMYVATLKIENGLYTFSKNGSTIATGKLANIKNKIAAKNAKRAKKTSYFN